MSTTISAISSSTWVSSLFSKIDTTNQGYIDKSGLQAALEEISSDSSSSAVEQVFSKLDADNDGKITKQEMSDGLQKLAEELDNQLNQSRIGRSAQEDSGYTKEELTSMISEIGDTDSKRTTLMQSIVDNFDKADTDGDGKVSHSEAMAYDQSSGINSATQASAEAGMPPPPPPQGASSSSEGTTYAAADTNQDGKVSFEELMAYQNSSASSTASDSLSVMSTIMQLMQAYGLNASASGQTSTITATA